MAESVMLDKAKDFAVSSDDQYKPLQSDCGAIRRMLIASINTAKSKQ